VVFILASNTTSERERLKERESREGALLSPRQTMHSHHKSRAWGFGLKLVARSQELLNPIALLNQSDNLIFDDYIRRVNIRAAARLSWSRESHFVHDIESAVQLLIIRRVDQPIAMATKTEAPFLWPLQLDLFKFLFLNTLRWLETLASGFFFIVRFMEAPVINSLSPKHWPIQRPTLAKNGC
jgi:hypothetical protein